MSNNDITLMEKMIHQASSTPTVTAEEFDSLFDSGESVAAHIDKDSSERPVKVRRVNVDFPAWLVEALDTEAEHLCVTRQALIKMWLAEKVAHRMAPRG